MDLLTMLSEQLAEKPALIEDRQGEEVSIWSHAELEANANRLAHVFRDLGVAPRERIVWCGKNSMMVVACGHAARKVGAISVPLNYRLTAAEAAFVVDDCDACVAFIDAEFVPLFEAVRGETAQLRHVLVFGGRPGSDMQSLEERMRAAPDAPPGISGESVHACVVKRPESELDAESLVAYAREVLAGYKVPRSVEFVQEIPKTGTGKILKRVLREPYCRDQVSQSAA